MGTRADFYEGRGADAVWLGSVAWDGYEWAQDRKCKLMSAKTPATFRKRVAELKDSRDDFTAPEVGWPWPWDTSATTDYVYFFDKGKVRYKTFDGETGWPDMKDKKNVQWSGNKSGLIVISAK